MKAGGKPQGAVPGWAQAQLRHIPAPLGTGTSGPQPNPAMKLMFLLWGDGDCLKLGEESGDALGAGPQAHACPSSPSPVCQRGAWRQLQPHTVNWVPSSSLTTLC